MRGGNWAISCESRGGRPWLLEQTIRQVVREAEPLRAAFFQVDLEVFQQAVDYPDIELACYERMGAQDPVKKPIGWHPRFSAR
ncbi:hypothetical protein MTIM_15300 [Mycobacterium timonense]|uniref:Uncharacterized protein n=1 Tax=Mycobacterium timonense TaxID=701043 RepID=A0A7I9Z3V2_9MYCO|nr:hypothetical protein MTIM_15300 [Mycobacterium timonense]